jgi:hypothetical protein
LRGEATELFFLFTISNISDISCRVKARIGFPGG